MPLYVYLRQALFILLLSAYSSMAPATPRAAHPVDIAYALAAPKNIYATPFLIGEITVSWSAVSGASVYEVEKSNTGQPGTFLKLATVPAADTSFRHTGLYYNQKMYYRVKAVSSGNESPYSAVVSTSTHTQQHPIAIMPLGDSNTEGGTSDDPMNEKASYRDKLEEIFQSKNIKFDFVGSEKSGSNYVTDTDHAGFGGSRNNDLLYILQHGHYNRWYDDVYFGLDHEENYLQAFDPEIILLHSGTNEISNEGYDNSEQATLELSQILDEIDKYELKTHREILVVVAKIIKTVCTDEYCQRDPNDPKKTKNLIIERYNTKVEAMVKQRIQNGDVVELVDMADANLVYQFADHGGDMADLFHPTHPGYTKMAPVWYAALEEFLSVQPKLPDTQAPQTTIATKPSAVSNSGSPTFSFSSDESGVSYQVSLDGAGFAPAANPYTTPKLADGAHTLEVRAVDAAGNFDSSPASYSWTIDTQAPAAPVVQAPANGAILANAKPTFSGTAEAGSTVAVSVDAVVVGSATAAADGKWSFVPTADMADGLHKATAKATDAAGNNSPVSNTTTFTVDATTPDTKIDSAPAALTNKNSASFSFSSNRQSVSYEAKLDNASFAAVANPLTLNALSDGQHTLTVRAKSQSGIVDPSPATFTWTVDTQAPAAPLLSAPAENAVLNTPNPAISGTAEAESTVAVYIAGDLIGTVAAGADGKWRFTPTTALAEGAQQLTAKATDEAGNTSSASSVRSFTIDSKAPETTISAGPAAITNSSNASFSFSSNEADVTFWVSLDGAAFAAATTPYGISGLADGAHTLSVRAVDVAGNTDATPATRTWTIDTRAPVAPAVTTISEDRGPKNDDQVTADNTLLVSGTAEANAAVEVLESGKSIGHTTANASGKWEFSYEATALPAGEHRFTATATDAASNTSPASAALSVTVDLTAPEVRLTTAAAAAVNAPLEIQIVFSEAIYNLTAADFSVTNGTLGSLAGSDKMNFTATVTPTADGAVQVELPAGKTTDLAGNLNKASNQLEATYDATRPRLTLSAAAAAAVNAPFEVTFTFTEPVTGFDAAAVAVSNGAVSDFVKLNAQTYTAKITPDKDGEVSVQVPANQAFDAAKNGNPAASALKRTYDAQRPAVQLSTTASSPTKASFTVTAHFSEPVADFSTADITLKNAQASQLQKADALTYTVLITPAAGGEVTVAVAANAVQDVATNGNMASNELSLLFDADRPAVTLTTDAPALTNAPLLVSIQISEPVSGFEVTDIATGNATTGDFRKVTDLEYTVLLTPVQNGPVTVSVPANKMQDEAANGNTASNTIEVIYDGIAPAGYSIRFGVEKVDVTNLHAVSLAIQGAEKGTTYIYSIRSSNGGAALTGTATVTATGFTLSGLDVSGLRDGTLTASLTLTDAAGNEGPEVNSQVEKLTKNIELVSEIAAIQVPFKTAFKDVPLPQQVSVTYTNGEQEAVQVSWLPGAYNGSVPGTYKLVGTLELKENTSNLNNKTAQVMVEVAPNQPPTAISLSQNTFRPDIGSNEVIGTFSTADPDDQEFIYALVAGEGDTDNALFEISNGNELRLKSNLGLSGISRFTVRVQSTDPYKNAIAQAFSLTKTLYQPQTKLKLVNAFSPDGDGTNDTWTVPELRYYNEVEVEVFDRAGRRLFHTTDPEEGWDGRGADGRILQGSYFYIIQVKDIQLVQKGVVTVLK